MNQKAISSAHKARFWLATFLSTSTVMFFTVLPGNAQFTADNQTNIIDGTAVNWPGTYHVGVNYVSDALFILNGGSLTNASSYVGHQQGGISNLAVVSGNGSAWTSGPVHVGYYGSFNRLVISDGGKVETTSVGRVGVEGSNNTVVVTGSGSGFRLLQDFDVGVQNTAVNNSLVISNGGGLFTASTFRISGASNNLALVTGSGSVLTNNLTFLQGVGNTLIVSNGGAVFSDRGYVEGHNDNVLITGSGSFWKNSGSLSVGYILSRTNNRLTIADGGSVLASNVYVSFFAGPSNNLIQVSGGNLTVTNLSGTGKLDVRRGRLAFDGGTITTDQLWLTNGVSSILEFNSGTLRSKATVISNAQPCVVGDGVASANFHLLGGVHSFQNGLRLRANGLLSGCGTVNGHVLVDPGGAVVSDCSSLVINGNLTNNGVLIVKTGSVLQSGGTVVNNGTIFLLNGGTTNFSGTFINNGSIRYSVSPQIAGLSVAGSDVVVRVPSIPTFNYRLQTSKTLQPPNWTNSGAAQLGTGSTLTLTEPGGTTNGPKRFYRVGVQ